MTDKGENHQTVSTLSSNMVHLTRLRIHTKEQVMLARMVPTGMDFCGSFRSPDMLEPVMIPTNRQTYGTCTLSLLVV